MPTKVAINGFGRIGRLVFRAMAEQGNPQYSFVAFLDGNEARGKAVFASEKEFHDTATLPGWDLIQPKR